MNHPISHKFARLTALAAACTMLLSIPAVAAPDTATDTNTETAVTANAPSAVDSSKRIIRRSQSNINKAANTADGSGPDTSVAPNANLPVANVINTPNTTPPAAQAPYQSQAQSQAQSQLQAPQVATQAVTDEQVPATRVYQRGPITSTGIDISGGQLANIPAPQTIISDVSFIPTVLIDQQQGANSGKLDVSMLDDFITDVSPNARHYPPNFPNRTQRHNTREKIKVLTEWIKPYADAPDASYEVLIRAAKLNGMGRNLDLGSEYAVNAGKYVDRAIKIDGDSAEANFLYGMMLAEGGGFKEGQKYLDRAVTLGYTEAEQSLAQSDLLSDRRDAALDRLRRLEQQAPDNDIIRKQIKIIEDGKFYIWDLSAPDVDVKPSS